MRLSCYIITGLLLSIFSGLTVSAERDKRPGYETNEFRLRLTSRTPNQIAAFYEARGFPPFAIEEVRNVCFITIGFRNKSDKIIWFDLSNWQFSTPDGPLKRILREDWKKRWNTLGLEKRFQSTFRWTLMPEKLDFRPYEGEGGNIIFPRTNQPIQIEGYVRMGHENGPKKHFKLDNVLCAKNPGRENPKP